MKKILLFTISIAIILMSACSVLTLGAVGIKGRDFFPDEKTAVHVGYYYSRYFDFNCNSSKKYDVILEAWENGEYSHDVGSIRSFDGKDLEGISISADDNGEAVDLIICLHGNVSGSDKYEIAIEKNGFTSFHCTDTGGVRKSYNASEGFYIFALMFKKTTAFSRPDVLETAKEHPYSVVMKIQPVD